MAWWILLLIQVGLQIVSGLLANKPNAKAEKNVEMPQNDGATPIPVVFGECLIKGATILDYFDFKAVPIKIRNPATFFLTTITVGYKYYLGIIFGLGWGKTPTGNAGMLLKEVLIDNRVAWQGTANYNEITPVYIHDPSFFGSPKQEGGVTAQLFMYNGETTGAGLAVQDPNDYWEAQRGLAMPHYRDLAYIVWHGPSFGTLPIEYGFPVSGYIGNSARLWPIAFKVVRQPAAVNSGSVTQPGGTPASSGDHANPIECLYECLTDVNWGAGIPAAQIDTDNFIDATTDVWSEGLGFSYLWTSASPVEEMISEILRFVDGALYTDLQTGKIKVKLVRPETPTITLTNDDFLEIESFTRGSWEDTKNEVRVTFPDHTKVDFEDSTAYWQELANRQIQGVTDAVEISYRGCVSAAQANRLAARDGRVYATPLAKLSGKLDRKAWSFVPGGSFYFTWPEQGIENLVMRVANVRLGTIVDGVISINAVEDVFDAGSATYGAPATTIWTDPLAGEAEDAPHSAVGEIPYFLQRDATPRIFGLAERPDNTHIAYDGAIDGDTDALNADFAPTGTLSAGLSQLTETDYDTTGFDVAGMADADLIEAGSSTSIANEGAGLALLGDPASLTHEWIAFESVTDNEDGTVTLDNIWRGVLDTPPREHAAGTRVWFFSGTFAPFFKALANGQSVRFEALTRTMRNQLTPADATNNDLTIASRALRPLPPYYVRLGGSYTNEIYSGSGDLVFTWREHARATMTQILKQSGTTTAAEAGVTYEVDIVDEDGSTVVRTVTGLSSPTYTYTSADLTTDFGGALQTPLYFHFYSKRDGLRSLYPWIRRVYDFGGSSSMAEDSDTMYEDADVMVET